ncbi:MAG: hypothetical protein QM765_13895 [Myxococcales bacterium]
MLLARGAWALANLGAQTLRTSAGGLALWQWGLGAVWLSVMCYFQGYRGLQRGFSSRVVARAHFLARDRRPQLRDLLAAPLFCIGLVRATRRRQRATVLLIATMASLVVAVSFVPQPYRALIDVGVAAGLVWGLAALGILAVKAVLGNPPAVPLDLPDGAESGAELQAAQP